MIDRSNIKCNYCNTNILLRFQMGQLDIPFSFCCPKCGVNINGIRKIIDKNILELENANEINDMERIQDLDNIEYFADFSIELPHRKIRKFESFAQMYSSGFSPFMDFLQLFESGDEYLDLMNKIYDFIIFKKGNWKNIHPLYNLYFTNNISLIHSPVNSISKNYVIKNKLDAAMALHQIGVIGFNKILHLDTLNEFMEIANKIFEKEKISNVLEFMEFYEKNENIEFNLKRVVKIYDRWISDFEKFIPVVVMSLGNISSKFNKDEYGIATISFENMINFYKDSYELILDLITIAVGLNNIFERESYDNFSDDSQVKNFEKYYELVKSARINNLNKNDMFSKCININKNVRNAIAHYTYDFEASSQKIIFYDKYKGKENNVEMYLCDLANLCYENIQIIIYLNELFYNLRKLRFICNGMIPNIKF